MNRIAIFMMAVVLQAAAAAQQGNLPLGGGARGVEGLKLVALSGVKASLRTATVPGDGQGVAQVTFGKAGEERRLVAVEAQLKGNPTSAKALALRYRLTLTTGQPPRWALVVFDGAGGSWFKVGEQAATGEFTDGRLSLTSLRPTAFSSSPDSAPKWEAVKRVWLGLQLDGAADGVLDLASAAFTSEPYKPTRPLRITGDGPGQWSAGADPAVVSALTTPNEGPDGKPCMKFEFRFPGGRHMYAVPGVPMPAAEVDGYTALRFRYKATLPPGIAGLLVMLGESNGCQYLADPPPPPSTDWTMVTIPFTQFKLGTWTKDPDGKLDLDQVNRVFIACHGAASGDGGPGVIYAADVEFVP